MASQSDKLKLLKDLEACLASADALGLGMVGIHISSAIEFLRAEDLKSNAPPSTVG